jgi:hypothetical protein
MQAPCCNLVYHASCGIQKLANAAHDNHLVNCECGNTIFECDGCFSVAAAETTIETVMAKPGVPAQVKEIKKKFTAENKARTAYKKYLKEKYAEFIQQVDIHKMAIKELKDSVNTTIKASEEFKIFRRLKSAACIAKNKFSAEHSIKGRMLRRLFGGSDWGRWYDSPVSILNRRFRTWL